uniref:Protein MON2 homolog n=1 Tax=Leersia perrieri TaxID=77586 RepID=A0A0D9V6A8_9ORYZ
MAFMAALEADLRALSAEARRRHPSVKDAAEHAILKLRSLSSSMEIAQNEDILRMFLVACSVKSVKLSVIGLSCLQKLISHDAVASSALKDILATLRDHAEMTDEIVQLKTLQTILIVFQSHLQPESEENMSQALDICLHLLESNRSSDSVRNTAAATFRQAVALVFDNVVLAESLPSSKASAARLSSRASSVADNVTRSFSQTLSLRSNSVEPTMREKLSDVGKLGLRLLEDLTALAAGGSVLRHQICSLLMTSLRTNVELEGEAGEPAFRRLVLRLVAHVIRLYSSSLVTESEVFLNMLVKVTRLDLPLWHQILVLEILRGFCIEAHTLRLLFQTFDMNPTNTNVVENIVRALALVVATIQASDLSEETLAAVAGMFSSKAKGIEWSMDNDSSNAAVLVASEAHTITLALEGLLGVVFTIATLTDEALDAGELESPKCELGSTECCGQLALLCAAMVNSSWLTILDSLSLILTRSIFTPAFPITVNYVPFLMLLLMENLIDRSQGEAIILEILKGYQAFTQACGVLRAIEPLNSFLASLCKFTINNPNEGDKRSIILSPGSKKVEMFVDQRDSIILTPKNVQVLETLAALDRAIHSPHASTQEVSASVSRLSRDTSGQYSDFHILSSLNSQELNQFGIKLLLIILRASVQHLIIFKRIKAVTDASEKDLISLGFQSIRVIMNEGLATIPVQCLDECILVTGAYGTQKTDINISLTAVGLLWTATDFVVKGLISKSVEKANGTNEEAESGGTKKEAIVSSSEKDIKQSPLKSVVDYNKLFFSVFSVLQKLGADDRPEVRNSAVRTLFQTLSTHGQKLSKTMWEDCLWIYVFPMLERVSHLASTSSKDEWQGKELGTRAGKAVHMLIHHSRNTAQKQWDETIVLVLGGWVLLLDFVKNGILNGSKEVALAAINCLQTFVGSNCPKGNLESSYVKSVLDIYELVLQTSPNYKNDSADKVKQEVLRGLGDLYVQAQSLFNDEMYLRLMAIMHLMIKSSMNPTDYDNELGSIPALQRGILEIIPMLRPTTMLSSMWSSLLLELLSYLNSHDAPLQKQGKEMHEQKSDSANVERSHLSNSSTKMDNAVSCGWGTLFVEKLVPIVVNLFLEAPQNERFSASPEVIQCLGRCMNTRRDNPKCTLWRVSAECFNRIVVDEVTHNSADFKSGMSSYKLSRARFWKEVADVYETFLVGSCGRVLSSDVPSVDSVTADETLEMTVLTVFGDNVLKLQKDAPVEVLQRLVNCLDRCASRTGSLPLQTVGLLYFRDKLVCYSERPLPSVRIEETICVLQELARLIINMETSNALSMPLYIKEALQKNESYGRAHLLALLPTFSELVVSREARVRELVQVLLRLIASELGLQRLT